MILVRDRALDQRDVDAFGVLLHVGQRAVDDVHPPSQVEKRHMAARAAAKPDRRKLQTIHCFFSRAVVINTSRERSRSISATVEPWRKIATVGQASTHFPHEVQL